MDVMSPENLQADGGGSDEMKNSNQENEYQEEERAESKVGISTKDLLKKKDFYWFLSQTIIWMMILITIVSIIIYSHYQSKDYLFFTL